MNNNIDHIVKNIFQAESFELVSLKQLNELVDTYPSFQFAHYMLSKKMQMVNIPDFEKELQKTALYFTNQLWLQWLLNQKNDAEPQLSNTNRNRISDDKFSLGNHLVEAAKDTPAIPRESLAKKTQDDVLSFGPYYTIDYFASQGIKVSQEENPKDKFGKQLKSFTDWLKTMKKLPQQADESESESDFDSARNSLIENFAAHSLEQKEVITETMAEVLIKQGKKERAIELYHKLSLLNPSKNAYFAAKIDQLK
ncbi:MAG TPA: hypothetical protein VKR53_14875 [Puia sp.]|nr:hypothetical protein [Puia sp.]